METKALVVGNWKMALSHKGELELAEAIKRQVAKREAAEIVVCPSFPALSSVAALLKNSPIKVGAQSVYWEETAAVTGAVSVNQIAPFARWCIVGHSETRELMGMSDEMVQWQVSILLQHGITPIVCLGETRGEYEADETVAKITRQMQGLLGKLKRAAVAQVVVAYEPIWAISSNEPPQLPDPDDVASVMLLMRKLVAERFDADIAQRLRLIYGGSVNGSTVRPYVQEPGINGFLVGSASLQPRQFMEIVQAASDAS